MIKNFIKKISSTLILKPYTKKQSIESRYFPEPIKISELEHAGFETTYEACTFKQIIFDKPSNAVFFEDCDFEDKVFIAAPENLDDINRIKFDEFFLDHEPKYITSDVKRTLKLKQSNEYSIETRFLRNIKKFHILDLNQSILSGHTALTFIHPINIKNGGFAGSQSSFMLFLGNTIECENILFARPTLLVDPVSSDSTSGDASKVFRESKTKEFTNCRFGNDLFNFSKQPCKFNNSEFYIVPDFTGTEELNPYSIFSDDCTFPKRPKERDLTRYRHLRILFNEVGSERIAQNFTALEQEAHYHLNLKNAKFSDLIWIEKLSSQCLKFIHDYGRDLWRPLEIITALFLGFFFFYLISTTAGFGLTVDEHHAAWIENEKSILNIFLWSASYAGQYLLGPVGLLKSASGIEPTNPIIRIVEILHVTLSTLLWFLFITNLRRRFKL